MITYQFPSRVVLVTGSSRGIGAAILTAFAKAGATCILHFWDDPSGGNRKDAEALAASYPNMHLLAADVREAGQIESLMQTVKQRWGGLDVLVNNAGILKDHTIRKMTLDEWHAVLSTNLTGVFHCCKYGSEILNDGGRIISIASIAGIIGFPGQANYAAAKAGVMGMTRVLAKELARRRITVNAIAPGIIDTSMMADIREEMRAEYIKLIPIGRFGKPTDIANAVLFLATEESEYITGQVLPVTGGWV